MSNRRCDKCEYWVQCPASSLGNCYLNPPIPGINKTDSDARPVTEANDFCSHFTAKALGPDIEPPKPWPRVTTHPGLKTTPEPTEPALKPCPFCGGQAQDQWGIARRVGCPRCDIYTMFLGPNKDERIAAWNKRTP